MVEKGKRSKTWRLTVRRGSLCSDVVGHFEQLAQKKAAQASVFLFSSTDVTFIDRTGAVVLSLELDAL